MEDLDSQQASPLIKQLIQVDSQELVDFIGMINDDQKGFGLSPSMEEAVMNYDEHSNGMINQAFAQQHPMNQVFYHQNNQQQPFHQNQHHQHHQQQQQQSIDNVNFVEPPHWATMPDLLTIPDNGYDFQVEMPPENPSLRFVHQKLFIKISSTVAFSASYVPNERNEPMCLRAMILFSETKDMHMPVSRCANHRKGDGDIYNVLKSVNPKAQYCGNETGQFFKDRLSIVIPIESSRRDEFGRAFENIGYTFECSSSCSSGINRRMTAIVFTLETQNTGEILGKKVIKFKVCSCPKRDADSELKQLMHKRKGGSNSEFPRGKIPKRLTPSTMTIKTEPEDSESPNEISYDQIGSVETTTLPLTIPTSLVPEALRRIRDLIAGEMSDDNTVAEPYLVLLRKYRQLRNQFPRNDE